MFFCVLFLHTVSASRLYILRVHTKIKISLRLWKYGFVASLRQLWSVWPDCRLFVNWTHLKSPQISPHYLSFLLITQIRLTKWAFTIARSFLYVNAYHKKNWGPYCCIVVRFKAELTVALQQGAVSRGLNGDKECVPHAVCFSGPACEYL